MTRSELTADACVDRLGEEALVAVMDLSTLASVESNWRRTTIEGRTELDRAIAELHVSICRAERHRRIGAAA